MLHTSLFKTAAAVVTEHLICR